MKMMKGKKQRQLDQPFIELLRTNGPFSDADYQSIGLILEQGRASDGESDIILLNPRVVDRPRQRFERSPLGMLPPTVLGLLGIQRRIHTSILDLAQPRCAKCGELAQQASGVSDALWPTSGNIACVVDGISDQIPLEEQCEVLGVDRALIDNLLKRVDETRGCIGEPVLSIFSCDRRDELERFLESWFARSGGAVRLVHFVSRQAEGVNIQSVFKGWRCGICASSFEAATLHAIDLAPACARCSGQGWISQGASLMVNDRFVACDDCHGYGCNSPIANYEFAGAELKDLASISIRRLIAALPPSRRGEFSSLSDSFIGDYPVAASSDLLSRGERLQFSIAAAQLSLLSNLTMVIDSGVEDIKLDPRIGVSNGLQVVHLWPNAAERLPPPFYCSQERELKLRDLNIGPLKIDSIALPVGSATVIQGGIGAGKSLLLSEIARRFAHKKQFSSSTSFGDLKRCTIVRIGHGVGKTVGDLLGLSAEVVAELSRYRVVQERGLCEADLVAPVNDHVGSIVIGTSSIAGIWAAGLSDLAHLMWQNDRIVGVIDGLPAELKRLTLSTLSTELAPPVRRFLQAFGALAKLKCGPRSLANELILLDEPFCTTLAHQRVLLEVMNAIIERGATIICAAAPIALEKLFACVVRLRVAEVDDGRAVDTRFFDQRTARTTSHTMIVMR